MGSEMCIRDSRIGRPRVSRAQTAPQKKGQTRGGSFLRPGNGSKGVFCELAAARLSRRPPVNGGAGARAFPGFAVALSARDWSGGARAARAGAAPSRALRRRTAARRCAPRAWPRPSLGGRRRRKSSPYRCAAGRRAARTAAARRHPTVIGPTATAARRRGGPAARSMAAARRRAMPAATPRRPATPSGATHKRRARRAPRRPWG